MVTEVTAPPMWKPQVTAKVLTVPKTVVEICSFEKNP